MTFSKEKEKSNKTNPDDACANTYAKINISILNFLELYKAYNAIVIGNEKKMKN